MSSPTHLMSPISRHSVKLRYSEKKNGPARNTTNPISQGLINRKFTNSSQVHPRIARASPLGLVRVASVTAINSCLCGLAWIVIARRNDQRL